LRQPGGNGNVLPGNANFQSFYILSVAFNHHVSNINTIAKSIRQSKTGSSATERPCILYGNECFKRVFIITATPCKRSFQDSRVRSLKVYHYVLQKTPEEEEEKGERSGEEKGKTPHLYQK